MVVPSIRYWSEFKKEKRKGKPGKKTVYKRLYFYSLVAGVVGMWVTWIGGIVFLFLNRFHSAFGWLTFSSPHKIPIQIIGFIVFYTGAVAYNINIIIVGKYLRPAPSGTLENHKLIQKGPFAVIRHPLYVSYMLITAGLGLVLLSYWLLIPTVLILIGIYPTARAEEAILIEQFGDEYVRYKQRVGMFFPKFQKDNKPEK